ncbi:hypothetical protein I3842_04G149600 [Carya illinoinensis]|uniref:Uncharacterized protein n=1 Tax=Carya illinoinensis TaxID=32201 RepID=A0A922F984_CARIL|nr:hypothetical protein I3842_04G149600 [Carya illinoinensis]
MEPSSFFNNHFGLLYVSGHKKISSACLPIERGRPRKAFLSCHVQRTSLVDGIVERKSFILMNDQLCRVACCCAL